HRQRVASKEERGKLLWGTETFRTRRQMLLWHSLILAAVETGLRRGELLKIEWKDIDFGKRTLNVRAEITKTGKSRLLPVSRGMNFHFWLYRSRVPEGERAPNERVFPISESALEQAWRRLCRRMGVTGLHFHDLRRTAGTYFDSER